MNLEGFDKRVSTGYGYAILDVLDVERKALQKAEDLVALKSTTNHDVLSRTLRNSWPFLAPVASANHAALTSMFFGQLIHSLQSATSNDKIKYFHEHRLIQLISALSVLIAVVLIIGIILALNVARDANARFGIAIAFILLFASGLSLSTGISRDNIFVATATYSAVLVVLMSSDLGDDGSGNAAA
jgi:hypothetical protein